MLWGTGARGTLLSHDAAATVLQSGGARQDYGRQHLLLGHAVRPPVSYLPLPLPAPAPAPTCPSQEMAKLEPFIMGMLTNFDALPLDRVHNMLKMFVSDPPYDKTLEQLGAYMARLVADEKLSLDGGTYRKR